VKLNITTEPLDNSAAFFFLALLRQTSPSQDEIAGFPIQTKRSTPLQYLLCEPQEPPAETGSDCQLTHIGREIPMLFLTSGL
jgi:hypothetical protein